MTATVQPPWLKEVQADAVDFANRIVSDFRLSLEAALRHAPNGKDAAARALVLNEFFNILPDVAARVVATYGSPAPDVEKTVHDIVAHRFALTRNEARLRQESKGPVSAS